MVRVEKAPEEIKQYLDDIVVMGANGHSILSDVLIGRTSRRAIRRCKKPVLVVRLPEDN